MTKADIVESVYERLGGFSKKEAAAIVDITLDTVKETLAGGEDVKISGFGVFCVRQKNERRGRNPKTGKDLQISRRNVVVFRPSPILRRVVDT